MTYLTASIIGAFISLAPAAAQNLPQGGLASSRSPVVTVASEERDAPMFRHGELPPAFLENQGQFDEMARYRLRAGDLTIWVTSGGLLFDISRPCKSATGRKDPSNALNDVNSERGQRPTPCRDRTVFAEDFRGIRNGVEIEPAGTQPGVHNFLGGLSGRSRAIGVRSYSTLVYRNAWPGIDIRLIAGELGLEQEFLVHPGADVESIRVAFRGINRLTTTAEGALIIHSSAGEMHETPPKVFQKISGKRKAIEGRFNLSTEAEYGFDLGTYDKSSDLLIDPTLLYGTFLGGSRTPHSHFQTTSAADISTDVAGSVYVTGQTESSDFPRTPGTISGVDGWTYGTVAFVTKLNPLGSELVYSSLISLPGGRGLSIAVDEAGSAYVSGLGVIPSLQTSCSGPPPFLVKLNASGSAFLHASYLDCVGYGQHTWSGLSAIALDSSGKVSVALNNNGVSIIVRRVDPELSHPASNLFYMNLSGYGAIVSDIAVDRLGNIYLTGYTYNDNFPTTSGAFQRTIPASKNCTIGYDNHVQCESAFVAKINPFKPADQSVVFATYLGGTDRESRGHSIAVDQAGNSYIGGYACCSTNPFPTTSGAFQRVSSGSKAGFVAKLSSDGTRLEWSTLLNGGESYVNDTALDAGGNVIATGSTRGYGFPVTPDAFQSSGWAGGPYAAFITKLNSTASALLYSTVFGGSGGAVGGAVAIDSVGDAYVAGGTSSSDFQVTPGAYQTRLIGASAAFIAKFSTGSLQGLSISGVLPPSGGNTGTVTLRVIGSGFHIGVKMSMRCAGNLQVSAKQVNVESEGRTARAVFDLTGVPPGTCDVSLMNVDGTTFTSRSAYTVEVGGTSRLLVDIITRPIYRVGQPIKAYLVVQNTGTVDAILPVVQFLGGPLSGGGVIIATEFLGEFSSPLAARELAATVTESPIKLGFEVLDSGGTVVSPTVWQNGSKQRVGFVLTRVPPGTTFLLGVTILVTSPAGATFDGTALVAGSFGSVFDAAPKCFVALVKNSYDLISPPGSKWDLACETKLLESVVSLAKAGFEIVENLGAMPEIFDFGRFFGEVVKAVLLDTDSSCLGPLAKRLPILDKVLQGFDLVMAGAATTVDCYEILNNEYAKSFKSVPVTSSDPNEKIGTKGIGSDRFLVGSDDPLPYAVFFENKVSATAPASEVVVKDKVDGNTIDLSTLALGPIVIPGATIVPPALPLQLVGQYSTIADLRPAVDLAVHVDVSFEVATGELTWRLKALDPSTNQPPEDPLAGFLPPGAGGSVSFTAALRPGLLTGTAVKNKATIVFDTNAPLDTPEWVNTIDKTPPVCTVNPLPAQTATVQFPVSWTGSDAVGEIENYTVLYSVDGGAFTPLLDDTKAVSTTFTGAVGKTYGFLCVAKDTVGNIEVHSGVAEASTRVVMPFVNVAADVTVTTSAFNQGRDRAGANWTAVLTVTNTSRPPSRGSRAEGIPGPLYVVLTDLSPNATMLNSTGVYNGSPYITISIKALTPGNSASVPIEFANSTGGPITYTAVTYSGGL